MRNSLGALLAIGLAGLQFLAILAVVFSSYITSETALLKHARSLLRDVGINTIEHSRGFLRPARGAAELSARLAQNDVIASDNAAAMEQLIFQQLQLAPQFSGVFLGTEDGSFVYVMRSDGPAPFRTKIIRVDGTERTTELIWRNDAFEVVERRMDPSDTYDPRTRPWYIRAREELSTIWTDPYIFFSSQQPGITLASPVMNGSDSVRGVVGVDIEISSISDFLGRLNIGDTGHALIIHENGNVIAHPDKTLLKAQDTDGTLRFATIDTFGDPIARAAFEQLTNGGTVRVEHDTLGQFTYDGETYVSILMPPISEHLPWIIAAYAPEHDFTKDIEHNRTMNIWIAALVAVITGLFGLALANYIHKPVRAFAVRSALISQGELDPSAPLPKTYQELEDANTALMQEIAARKDSEKQVAQLNKDLSNLSRYNTMGQLAAGLAHELNQPLTAITQNTDSALLALEECEGCDPELREIVTEIETQSLRAGEIIRALRGFIRKDEGARSAFDLEKLVGQTRRLVAAEAHEAGAEIRTEMRDISPVDANRLQVAQVIVNLLRNAIEAVAENPNGDRLVTVSAMRSGPDVLFCVADTGPGVDPSVNLFSQFETTKPGGMGLGLSICRSIVESNGGRLWHEQAKPHGARFCFTLPAAAQNAQPQEKKPSQA